MDIGTFLADNKELVATIGSMFVAILGVAAALIGRRVRIVHVIKNGKKTPRTALPPVDEPAEPSSDLLLNLPLMLQPEVDQKPPKRMPDCRSSFPVAAPKDWESLREAVRAAEEVLRRRDVQAQEIQPPLPLTVQNRLRREVSCNPEGDLKRLSGLFEDVPAAALLPYLVRLAEVERAWRALAAARESLDRTETRPEQAN